MWWADSMGYCTSFGRSMLKGWDGFWSNAAGCPTNVVRQGQWVSITALTNYFGAGLCRPRWDSTHMHRFQLARTETVAVAA